MADFAQLLTHLSLSDLRVLLRQSGVRASDARKRAAIIDALTGAAIPLARLLDYLSRDSIRNLAEAAGHSPGNRSKSAIIGMLVGDEIAAPSPRAISEATGRLLFRLVDGWSPQLPVLTYPLEVVFGGARLDAANCIVRSEADGLLLRCRGQGISIPEFRGERRRSDLILRYNDSVEIRAESAFVASARHTFDDTELDTISIRAAQWTMSSSSAPKFWVSKLEGDLAFAPGNLNFRRSWKDANGGTRVESSNFHLRIHGAYEYYVIRGRALGRDQWYLVVSCQEPPDKAALYRDVLALQFLVGQPIAISTFLGVSEERAVVAALEAHLGAHAPRRHAIPAVPVRFAEYVWVAPFFERISANLATEPRLRLAAALAAYVEATADRYPELAYSRIATSCDALARRVIRERGLTRRTLLKSATDWDDWVNSSRETIARLASADDAVDQLLSQILDAGIDKTDTAPGVVLRASDAALTGAAEQEIGRMLATVQDGALIEDGDINQALARLDALRQVFVGVVAAVVGYDGPIDGTTKQNRSAPVPITLASSAQPSSREQALVQFTVVLAEPPAAPDIEWPEFALRPPAPHPLVARIAAMLDGLSVRTGGAVVARLRWVPEKTQNSIRYDAVMLIAKQPTSQSHLFSVVIDHESSVLLVEDSRGDGHVLTSEGDVDNYMAKLVKSEDMAARVDSLLSLARLLGADE